MADDILSRILGTLTNPSDIKTAPAPDLGPLLDRASNTNQTTTNNPDTTSQLETLQSQLAQMLANEPENLARAFASVGLQNQYVQAASPYIKGKVGPETVLPFVLGAISNQYAPGGQLTPESKTAALQQFVNEAILPTRAATEILQNPADITGAIQGTNPQLASQLQALLGQPDMAPANLAPQLLGLVQQSTGAANPLEALVMLAHQAGTDLYSPTLRDYLVSQMGKQPTQPNKPAKPKSAKKPKSNPTRDLVNKKTIAR